MAKLNHVLVLMPAADQLPDDCPEPKLLLAALARRDKKVEKLKSDAVSANASQGGLRVWTMVDGKKSRFQQLTQVREAFEILLEEEPESIDVLVVGDEAFRNGAAALAAYVGLANGTPMPTLKQEDAPKPLQALNIWGSETVAPEASILAEANLLARMLTALPPNALTPAAYRARLKDLSSDLGWRIEEFDQERLRSLGAGAFLAVAQGSAVGDAAIVRLTYEPAAATETAIAVVGKGICFDTGGHNLKPAKYMAGMHEDMAGSAVALAILVAATRLQLPVRMDAWLALARNEISPQAYRQGDVVNALDGSTIEVVHTDAEGRMVLADTLHLAAKEKPALIVDFATLTGSMLEALGTRYSGVFATSDELGRQAVAAGVESGERVCVFPMDEDYEEALDSDLADIKQCTLDGEADHILAALFLKRFVGEQPWVHMDLAAASCEGGLGAIASDQTGFGVAWGVAFLRDWLEANTRLP
ncbi:MAG TPA: leucyl aminopeptidase family protein [Rhodocyclaceae bacterium]|nr:leucyl aminopeptidase family protein [Rhodocyclaceae bacterium]